MKRLLLPFAFFCALTSVAQDSTLQIKDYKYRTTGFRALALAINVSGGANKSENLVGKQKSRVTHAGPLYANYYHIRSTDRRLQITSARVEGNYTRRRENEMMQNNRSLGAGSQVWLDHQRRDYRTGNWFWETGNQLDANTLNALSESGTVRNETNEFRIRNFVTLGFGKGRIEWVQDAQMAVYLLNDLARQNLLERKPTKEESLELARLVTDINNRRVFDFRRRRIYELSRLDSFLKSSGLAPQTDIRHFTTINDNWAFAINPFRRSGTAAFVRLKPGIDWNKSKTVYRQNNLSSENTNLFRTFYLIPEIGLERYRPLSLKWQQNFTASVYYLAEQRWTEQKSVNVSGSTVTEQEGYHDTWNLNIGYGMGFYPNTRTAVVANVSARGFYDGKNVWGLQPYGNLEANYFLGYRTYLTAQVNGYYAHNHFGVAAAQRSTQWSTGFSLQLSHFVF